MKPGSILLNDPDETPGMFARVHSLLSTPASVTVLGPGAPGQGCTLRAQIVDSLEFAYANEFTKLMQIGEERKTPSGDLGQCSWTPKGSAEQTLGPYLL